MVELKVEFIKMFGAALVIEPAWRWGFKCNCLAGCLLIRLKVVA